MTDAAAARALQRLRATIAAHDTGDDGVVFDSRAWLITARLPASNASYGVAPPRASLSPYQKRRWC
jgi:hypothetical protein